MTKEQAVERIKEIQRGGADSFCIFPDELKGKIALSIQNNTSPEMKGYDRPFGYGFKYGEMWGLMKAFDIAPQDLRYRSQVIKAVNELGRKMV